MTGVQTCALPIFCSTSDQTDYMKYPYIAGNILAGVLPEQAAVWSYPVGVGEIGKPLAYDGAWVEQNITKERIVMNMINSVLGRMHLASHIELLSEDQLKLVKEGVQCYHLLTDFKKHALPYFPNGFCRFGDETVSAGLLDERCLYLAVWNLSDKNDVRVQIDQAIKDVEIVYPKESKNSVDFGGSQLRVNFDIANSAVLLKLSLEENAKCGESGV